MYQHICTGAECPWCSPFALRPLAASMVRTGWTDSTGTQVAEYPKRLGIGTTVIIQVGTMENRMVLCQQRRDNQAWGFPGGSQHIGESIETCARREAKEETGLAVRLLGLTSVDSDPYQAALCTYPDGVVQYTNLTFLARPLGYAETSPPPAVVCCHESLELRWVLLHQLPQPFLVSHQWRFEQAMAHTGPFLPVR